MIPFEEAKKILKENVRRLPVEEVFLDASLNRVLAENIVSDMDMPPFNKAAMDGYACKKADITKELELLEIIGAGHSPTKDIGAGQCSKIMTGAIVPTGADCIVKVEHAEQTESGKIKFKIKDTPANIAYHGEDVKKGDLVLKAGTVIKPQHIAILAMVGAYRVKVSAQPKIGVISTGTEIVEPFMVPTGPQIRNSNSYQLCAQIESMGCKATYYGIGRDDPVEIQRMFTTAINESDVVIVSGGLSMGDFDYVPKVIAECGVKILFNRVAIKPGRPTTFGVSPDVFIFGLPGNPVSTFILFEILIKPFLYLMMGRDASIKPINLPLGETLTRKETSRRSYIPISISLDSKVHALKYNGSAHIASLHDADGFIAFPIGVAELKEGSPVIVLRI